jgi:hypothetical protein
VKRLFRKAFLVLLAGCVVYAVYLSTLDLADAPPLQDGDIVFQTSWTDQSVAVGLATGSLYLHTGMVKMTGSGPAVMHAAAQVEETPLKAWIDGGILKRFAVYRYRGITPRQASRAVVAAEQYYGRNYDLYFLFDNNKIYCSELPYLAYQQSGINIGKISKISELSVDNYFAKKVIEARWRSHPKCYEKDLTFEQCYAIIMAQELVTPASIAADPHFERIFTNYP